MEWATASEVGPGASLGSGMNFFRRGGKFETEARAGSRQTLNIVGTSVLADDAIADREAQPGAPSDAFGREERIVYPGQILRWNSHAAIADLNLDMRVDRQRRNAEASTVRHGVLGVEEHIQEHLL